MSIQIQIWIPKYMHVNPDPSRLKAKASPCSTCFTCLHHLPPAGYEVIFWKQTLLLISGGSFYHWLYHFSKIIQFHWLDCTCFWDQFQIRHKMQKTTVQTMDRNSVIFNWPLIVWIIYEMSKWLISVVKDDYGQNDGSVNQKSRRGDV